MSKAKKIILAAIIFVIAAALTVVSVFIGINWGDQPEYSNERNTEAIDAAKESISHIFEQTDSTATYVMERNGIRFTTELDTRISEEDNLKYFYYDQTVEYLQAPKEAFSDIIAIYGGTKQQLYTDENGAPAIELTLKYTRSSDGAKVSVSYSSENSPMYYIYEDAGIAFRFPLPQEEFTDLTVKMSTVFVRDSFRSPEVYTMAQFIHQTNNGDFEWKKLYGLFSESPFVSYGSSLTVNDPGFDLALVKNIPLFFD